MAKKKSTLAWFAKTPKRTIRTSDDVKMAILLVSVAINLVVLIGWLAVKLSNQYDEQVTRFLFG